MNPPVYAGFGRRLLAVIIDHAFFGAMMAALCFVLAFPVLLMGMLSMFTTATITIFSLLLWFGGLAVFIGAHWLYYAGFEASSLQATPGKIALGLKVVDLDLQRVTLKRSTIRYASRYLSTLLLYFGYLISFFTERRQTLHDLISDTLVVRQESLPQAVVPVMTETLAINA